MIQFYSPDILSSGALGPEEAHHCSKVLRKKAGDTIYVTDGMGKRYECVITKVDTRSVLLEIIAEQEIPKSWDFNMTLIVAPTKNADRMAWLVEKATEIGVDSIVFVKCSHSERKTVNIERLGRNAISAMNQSLKTHLPLLSMASFNEILKLRGDRFFGYCDSETQRVEFVNRIAGRKDIAVAIGPEGDFSPEEVKLMREAGFEAVTFGDERLRTETAALYAVTATHVINDYNKQI